jgi:hypothetical protein
MTKESTLGKLPVLIRYRAQDYDTRWVHDPRIGYVKAFREDHRDDGFVAIIPRDNSRVHRRVCPRCFGCRNSAWLAFAIVGALWVAANFVLRLL